MKLQLELDDRLKRVGAAARVLPGLVARHAPRRRAAWLEALRLGEARDLKFETVANAQKVAPDAFVALEQARVLAKDSPAGALYLSRLDELELELRLIESLGQSAVRKIAVERFGSGRERVKVGGSEHTLAEIAKRILDRVRPEHEDTDLVKAEEIASILRKAGEAARVVVDVRIEKNLVANAAAGERTVFISSRALPRREAYRLAAHEVLGHLVAASNSRAQRLALLRVGTAESFTDQEGIALCLEEQSGLMGARRMRIIAARVYACDQMHDGTPFGELLHSLHHDYAFSPEDAVTLAHRAFRGGGIPRDLAYLRGWQRVRAAVQSEQTCIDELRRGRVSVASVVALRELESQGWVSPPLYKPNLERSLAATGWGTSRCTSPPSLAASLMIFDDT